MLHLNKLFPLNKFVEPNNFYAASAPTHLAGSLLKKQKVNTGVETFFF
jgi:hypothetical protein